MKKVLLLISIVFLSIAGFSQYSVFTVFSENGEQFILFVDGQQINNVPQSRVADLENSNQMAMLKIVFADNGIPTLQKNVMLKSVDNEFQKIVFKITQNKKGAYKLRMNSVEVFRAPAEHYIEAAPLNSPPSNEALGTVVTTENVTTSVSVSGNNYPSANSESASVSMNLGVGGENVNFSMNVSEGNTSNTATTTTTYTETTTTTTIIEEPVYVHEEVVYVEEPQYTGRCPYPTSEAEFSKIKAHISSKSFEDSKLTTAKDIAKNKCLTASQISRIMGLFTFEDSRIEFAAFVYEYAFDPDNYYEVYDAFEFELSIDELKERLGL